MNRTIVLLSAALALCSAPALASGNHFGWCNGVGNPHQSSGCGGVDVSVPTPSNVPVANQLPQTGPVTGPTPTGTPAVITIFPNPPTVITGTSPVAVPAGQVPLPSTGAGTLPVVVQPVPQTVWTGVGPVPQVKTLPNPSFRGTGAQKIVVQPLHPQVFTGTSPVGVQGRPAPSITGQALPTIIVVPNPPTVVTGFGSVPAAVIIQGVPGPGFSGTSAIPPLAPMATPGQVPTAIPGATPGAKPIMVPRPRPSRLTSAKPGPSASVAHKQSLTAPPLGRQHVTNRPGRQEANNEPRFAGANGGAWHCLASGHGKRRTRADGEVASQGALRHVGAVDVLGRDLPALHPDHAECIISVRRREK
jgi:hypothetical protein